MPTGVAPGACKLHFNNNIFPSVSALCLTTFRSPSSHNHGRITMLALEVRSPRVFAITRPLTVLRSLSTVARGLSVACSQSRPCVAFLWCCVCYFPHPHCVLLPSPAACATSLPRSLCYFPHPDGLSLRRPLASGSLSTPVMHTCNWRGCVHSCAYHAPIMRPLRRLPRHHCRAPYLRRCSLVSHI